MDEAGKGYHGQSEDEVGQIGGRVEQAEGSAHKTAIPADHIRVFGDDAGAAAAAVAEALTAISAAVTNRAIPARVRAIIRRLLALRRVMCGVRRRIERRLGVDGLCLGVLSVAVGLIRAVIR